jgi:hypothetical protein
LRSKIKPRPDPAARLLHSTIEVRPMVKFVVTLVVSAFLTVVTVAKAQTLECGYVTLRLGEPEKEAVEQLGINGYKNFASVDESQPKIFQTFLGPGGLPPHPVAPTKVCEVEFVKHKITYVARHWNENVRSELDAIHNVVEAIQAIMPPPGHATCDIFALHQPSPEHEGESATISCGSHTITIQVGKANGKSTYDISENIGSM